MTRKSSILGGTTEARQLAGELAARADFDITLSLAGRTENPVLSRAGAHRRLWRRGGAGRLSARGTDRPADRRDASLCGADVGQCGGSRAACRRSAIRASSPAWEPVEGDRWTLVDDAGEAVAALGTAPRNVFLPLGRQELAASRPRRSTPTSSAASIRSSRRSTFRTRPIFWRAGRSPRPTSAICWKRTASTPSSPRTAAARQLRQDRRGAKARHRGDPVPPAGTAGRAVRATVDEVCGDGRSCARPAEKRGV